MLPISTTQPPQTVYNFEVQDFHTYHIGEYGVWVHNADCCDLSITPNGKTLPKGEPIFNTKDGNGQTIAIYKGKDGQWYRTSDYNKTDARPYNIPKISTDRTPKKALIYHMRALSEHIMD
ncbi:HINT domain-containing protein [Moraxella catarrhalis]|uniref:HINT domain-containing protein n=1 Tax=Moraxella catarrhalis TaxID=480 RepID=UPI00217EF683|nr:HINT domain-containing protein [Moraxella catarrhalis]